jgi:hypothetical protein
MPLLCHSFTLQYLGHPDSFQPGSITTFQKKQTQMISCLLIINIHRVFLNTKNFIGPVKKKLQGKCK